MRERSRERKIILREIVSRQIERERERAVVRERKSKNDADTDQNYSKREAQRDCRFTQASLCSKLRGNIEQKCLETELSFLSAFESVQKVLLNAASRRLRVCLKGMKYTIMAPFSFLFSSLCSLLY